MNKQQADYCDKLKNGDIETWRQGLSVLLVATETMILKRIGVSQSLSTSASIMMKSRDIANKAIIKVML